MSDEKSCVFCEIVSGKAKAYTIFEDELSFCMLDIQPFARGHSLVIPKRHVTWWHELTIEETGSVFKTARTVANVMMKTFSPEFVFMYVWGLRVPHAHIHLIPSTRDDIFNRFFHALEKFQESPQELAELAEKEKMLETMKLLLKMEFHKEE